MPDIDAKAAGITLRPFSTRVHLRAAPAEDALQCGYDYWSAVDFLFSEFRAAYLAGAVKGITTFLRTNDGRRCAEAFNVVPVPEAQRSAQALVNRAEALSELQTQYKNAIARAIGGHPKQRSRIRARFNAHFAGGAPPPAETAEYFAGHPDAVAAAAGIRDLWEEIAALPAV